jgi:hypothetical protein
MDGLAKDRPQRKRSRRKIDIPRGSLAIMDGRELRGQINPCGGGKFEVLDSTGRHVGFFKSLPEAMRALPHA